jgi:hypothetical protein
MSIKTTREMTREDAITRIAHIHTLAIAKDYRKVESNSVEPMRDVESFINNFKPLTTSLEKWTNTMLANMMDRPFIRFHYSENYTVVDSL